MTPNSEVSKQVSMNISSLKYAINLQSQINCLQQIQNCLSTYCG